jgi:putative sigma-54 modulation protein
MIANITMSANKLELDGPLKNYITKKIGRLDRFLPRHARKSVHAEVVIAQVNRAHGNKYECEVVIHVPDVTITAKDSTLNSFAAVDIVEEKLKNQLKKYKDSRTEASQGGRHGILRRFKTRLAGGEAI